MGSPKAESGMDKGFWRNVLCKAHLSVTTAFITQSAINRRTLVVYPQGRREQGSLWKTRGKYSVEKNVDIELKIVVKDDITLRQVDDGTHRQVDDGTNRQVDDGTHRQVDDGTHRQVDDVDDGTHWQVDTDSYKMYRL
ncbi:unnamed protein product [Lymnaea stagnalis]|uniref:Uncharacterized protein n=1 Tax=Lymnaea stagnalis TaxID=6523 RepID=A0AAV2IE52_LYMST